MDSDLLKIKYKKRSPICDEVNFTINWQLGNWNHNKSENWCNKLRNWFTVFKIKMFSISKSQILRIGSKIFFFCPKLQIWIKIINMLIEISPCKYYCNEPYKNYPDLNKINKLSSSSNKSLTRSVIVFKAEDSRPRGRGFESHRWSLALYHSFGPKTYFIILERKETWHALLHEL